MATVLRRNGVMVSGNGPSIGAVARSPGGTFGAFVGSHPIQHITWGEAPKPSVCP